VTLPKLLTPTLLTDQVYAVLHEAIISGELPAGSRLRVRDLAEQVGTSVMPVREAIRRLEEAGLAEREPHKGAVVKGLTLEELVHVYGVRRLLEGEAARLGAERITADDCERMQAEYDLMVTAVGERRVVDLLDHDEALLTILYTASGNPVLVSLISTLWQRCRAYKVLGAQGTLVARRAGRSWRHRRTRKARAPSDGTIPLERDGVDLGRRARSAAATDRPASARPPAARTTASPAAG
jgi:DNA-binding GntR family transcriptional regulator